MDNGRDIHARDNTQLEITPRMTITVLAPPTLSIAIHQEPFWGICPPRHDQLEADRRGGTHAEVSDDIMHMIMEQNLITRNITESHR